MEINNSEFFINALQNLYQDRGDMSYDSRIKEFVDVWSMLVEKVELFEKGQISKEFFDKMKELKYNNERNK